MRYAADHLVQQLDQPTIDKLVAAGHLYDSSDGWESWGRKGEAAVIAAVAEATEARFTKHDGAWCVSVPAALYAKGESIEVVKRDGATKTVTLGPRVAERDGRIIAALTDAPRSSYRPRRSYNSDGETHYPSRGYYTMRDGGQIWDYS